VTGRETMTTILFCGLIGIAACCSIVFGLMLHRSRQRDRRWQYESRVQLRIVELLRQEWEDSLPPEARQRLEAQRQHLQELRVRAEAELAAEARGGQRRA
jgi:hypothetical protein